MSTLDITYPAILDLIGGQEMTDKQQSRQLLFWFLQNYYYLDEIKADECICDNNYDKGVDAIYIDEHLQRIDVFSCVLGKKTGRPSGQSVQEGDVKEFAGSLNQFATGDSVRQLALDTTNVDLKRLLDANDEEIAKKIDSGKYLVHGVYVTNKKRDLQTEQYLNHISNITLWDSIELQNKYVSLERKPPISKPVDFNIKDTPIMEYQFGDEFTMIVVPLPAADLVRMDGIENNALFAPNVRYWLGEKTPVNKDLTKSIQNSEEHKQFPAFHNGIIILAETVNKNGNTLSIANYSVANGCQSLRGLYENRVSITPELRILTKLFNVSPNSELAKKITNRTNNQNGIRNRDFQSKGDRQIGLQNEIHDKYPGKYFYRIARGEHPEWNKDKVIENELAGKILLSFDLKRPAECSLDIFTEKLHKEIFHRKEVNADRITVLHNLLKIGNVERTNIKNRSVGVYSRTKFFLLYLTRLVLESDEYGNEFIKNPSTFLKEQNGEKRLYYSLQKLTNSLIRIFSRQIDRQNERGYFDYKTELKNSELQESLCSILLNSYDAIVANGYEPSFTELWKQSKNKV